MRLKLHRNKLLFGVLSIALAFTFISSIKPDSAFAAKAGLDCGKAVGSDKCADAGGGGDKKPADSDSGGSFDACSAAFLKTSNDQGTCTKVNNCGTSGDAFNPTEDCLTILPRVAATSDAVKNGLQIVFGVAAGVALISLGIAAFNFATAATDHEKISRSKKAVVFSLIGLTITLMAEAIVTTVIKNL